MPAVDAKLAERILSHVSEKEIVSMACDVVNIPSPTGEELEMSRYIQRAMEALGLKVAWQEVEEGRANVVGRWGGVGKSLMFNGHMDTSNSGRESFLTGIGYKPHAVVRDGFVYGLGIYNMKGALVCYLQAVRALQAAGVKLEGEVIVAAVVGEIEKSQWGEFTGKEFRGYGVGTHYLVNHGVVPDMCILGEPTDLQLVLSHYGSLWVRLSTFGPYVHTGFTEGRLGENALSRMHTVMAGVLEWIPSWEEKATHGGRKGVVNLGCVRAGHPWRASRTPDRADLFLDVLVPPSMTLQDARREVERLVERLQRSAKCELEWETYVSVPGAEIAGDHEMVKAIEASHASVLGGKPERGTVLWCSDASVLSRYGIPTVNYGPSSGPRDAEGEKVSIQTLVDVTRIYALTTAALCGAH